jgi:hypothetical protein
MPLCFKIVKFFLLHSMSLYMFRTLLCPSSGAFHHCTCSLWLPCDFVFIASSSTVLLILPFLRVNDDARNHEREDVNMSYVHATVRWMLNLYRLKPCDARWVLDHVTNWDHWNSRAERITYSGVWRHDYTTSRPGRYFVNYICTVHMYVHNLMFSKPPPKFDETVN